MVNTLSYNVLSGALNLYLLISKIWQSIEFKHKQMITYHQRASSNIELYIFVLRCLVEKDVESKR